MSDADLLSCFAEFLLALAVLLCPPLLAIALVVDPPALLSVSPWALGFRVVSQASEASLLG